MSKKLKFGSVVSLVIGSQIGSGVFLLPATLAALGSVSLFGWFISATGAILLALIFAQLSMLVSKGGGPHVYIEKAFGRKAAFFMSWTYWLISWISSIAVIVAAVGYLSPFIGFSNPFFNLLLEVVIVTTITLINIRGAATAGFLEIFLTLLKCIPLLIIPAAALFFIKADHFQFEYESSSQLFGILNTATLMTFWGFIGLETATTTAGIIENPTKVIPRAVMIGTLIVAAIYFMNSFGVMGIVPPDVLVKSQAPYVDAVQVMFGKGWDLAIAAIGFLACIGTLNAWVLTSGQIAVEASKDGLFPAFFSKTNRAGAPYISLLIVFVCTSLLLGMTLTPNILEQLNMIIDVSVTAFLLIYLACTVAFIKIALENKIRHRFVYLGVSALAISFCVWVLAFASLQNLAFSFLFVLSGLPIYWVTKDRSASTKVLQ